MGQTPDHIREDIEETRERMGETVEAIGYKADVKSRAKDAIVEKKDAVMSRASDVVPDRQQLRAGARKVGVSKENPLGLGIAAAAAGFVVGTLLPATRAEDERLGEMSDELSQEVRERTKGVAREAVDSARQTVGERSSDEAEQMASSLRDKAQEVGSGSNPS